LTKSGEQHIEASGTKAPSSSPRHYRPRCTVELLHSEYRFLTAMQEFRYGRFRSLRIVNGERALSPWPATVQSVKFGSANRAARKEWSEKFELREQASEFFGYVRSVDHGEIQTLEIHDGLPFRTVERDQPPQEGPNA
jgi:hypothetical protein